MFAAVPEQHDVAHQFAGGRDLDAESQALPGSFSEVRAQTVPSRSAMIGGVHRLERHVPADVRSAAVGQQRGRYPPPTADEGSIERDRTGYAGRQFHQVMFSTG